MPAPRWVPTGRRRPRRPRTNGRVERAEVERPRRPRTRGAVVRAGVDLGRLGRGALGSWEEQESDICAWTPVRVNEDE